MGFVLRTILWLPVCFGVWYFLSILYTPLLATLVDMALKVIESSAIERVVADGNDFTVLTYIRPANPDQSTGEILFQQNPLKYGYGVPLYTALVLSTDSDDLSRLLHWLFGMVVLVLVVVFGNAAEILKVVAFQLGEPGRMTLGFSSLAYDALALAYQLGYLILPSVVPIMLWLGQFGRVEIQVPPSSQADRP